MRYSPADVTAVGLCPRCGAWREAAGRTLDALTCPDCGCALLNPPPLRAADRVTVPDGNRSTTLLAG